MGTNHFTLCASVPHPLSVAEKIDGGGEIKKCILKTKKDYLIIFRKYFDKPDDLGRMVMMVTMNAIQSPMLRHEAHFRSAFTIFLRANNHQKTNFKK